MAGEFGFDKKMARLSELKNTLPNIIAHTGERFFQQEFQKSEWNGNPWQERKKETKANKGKKLLVASGILQGSLQNSIRAASMEYVEWGSDVPYAGYQNYGTDTIPERKFMGDSPEFREIIATKVQQAYSNVFG